MFAHGLSAEKSVENLISEEIGLRQLVGVLFEKSVHVENLISEEIGLRHL